jgi:hypothetical protein
MKNRFSLVMIATIKKYTMNQSKKVRQFEKDISGCLERMEETRTTTP